MKMKLLGVALLLVVLLVAGAFWTDYTNTPAQAQAVQAPSPLSLSDKQGAGCTVLYKAGNVTLTRNGVLDGATDQWVIVNGVESVKDGTITAINGKRLTKPQTNYRRTPKQYWIANESIVSMAFELRRNR